MRYENFNEWRRENSGTLADYQAERGRRVIVPESPRQLIRQRIADAEEERDRIHTNEGSARARRSFWRGRVSGLEAALTVLDDEGVDIG